jgi:hypothetical protein
VNPAYCHEQSLRLAELPKPLGASKLRGNMSDLVFCTTLKWKETFLLLEIFNGNIWILVSKAFHIEDETLCEKP